MSPLSSKAEEGVRLALSLKGRCRVRIETVVRGIEFESSLLVEVSHESHVF